MKKYILSIDQGTTSTRAILFDKKGSAIAIAQREVRCFFPFPGWVEQDPLAIWLSVVDVINEVLINENLTLEHVEAIGITNQRETTVVWDHQTGMPVYRAIVWQSRQSQSICEQLSAHRAMIHQKTGLLINPYFSASKIRFILDHIEDGQARAERGELRFGTIDSWLLYKLTNGKVHATDVTNAARTMLYDINQGCWDDELLALFQLPSSLLPKVCDSSYRFGQAEFFGSKVWISGMAGDQQAALFGQACFATGDLKNTYGTGCFMLMNVGSKPIYSQKGLLTTIAWSIKGEVTYALEGSVFVGGAAVQWLRDQMVMIAEAADSEPCAWEAEKRPEIYVVPAFVGLGTPYWDDDARGAVFGLTRDSDRNDFVRATLNAIAYQSMDVIEVMKEETHLCPTSLKVDGGATANGYLMKTQADLLGLELHLPQCLETTALGVAYLAGLAQGFWRDLDEIKQIHRHARVFTPTMDRDEALKRYQKWKKAVAATRAFR